MPVDEQAICERLVIRRERAPDALVLALYGSLDLTSSPRLHDELIDAEAAGETRLVVDLSGLEFMDSTGLHVLLDANERSARNGHRLSLHRGQQPVHRIFELTNATTLFRFDG